MLLAALAATAAVLDVVAATCPHGGEPYVTEVGLAGISLGLAGLCGVLAAGASVLSSTAAPAASAIRRVPDCAGEVDVMARRGQSRRVWEGPGQGALSGGGGRRCRWRRVDGGRGYDSKAQRTRGNPRGQRREQLSLSRPPPTAVSPRARSQVGVDVGRSARVQGAISGKAKVPALRPREVQDRAAQREGARQGGAGRPTLRPRAPSAGP